MRMQYTRGRTKCRIETVEGKMGVSFAINRTSLWIEMEYDMVNNLAPDGPGLVFKSL